MSLRLRVMTGGPDGPTEHVYTDADGLLAGERTLTESLGDAEIELADLPLELSQGGAFLGATSRDGLPAVSTSAFVAGYRAVLEKTTPAGTTVVLEGLIPRVEVAFDETPALWSFPLMAAAQADLWERLDAVRLSDFGGEGYEMEYDEVPFLEYINTTGAYATTLGSQPQNVRYVRGPERIPGPSAGAKATHRWYRLGSVVRAVLRKAEGVSLSGPGGGALPRLTYDVRYVDDDGEARTITRPATLSIMSLGLYGRRDTGGAYNVEYGEGVLTLPDWSGAELVERALALCGWRLSARYAAYPSTEIEVAVLPATWPDPSAEGLPAIDDRKARGGYTRRAEADTDSVAVRHAGPLRGTTPGLTMLRDTGFTYTASYLPAPAPPWASLALTRWRFELAGRDERVRFEDDDRRPDIDDPTPEADATVATGFSVPQVGWVDDPYSPVLGAYETGQVHAAHPDYSERVVYGYPLVRGVGAFDAAPARTACYVGAVVRVPGASSPVLLYGREPVPSLPPDQEPIVNEAWAPAAYRRRQFAAEVEVADGEFYVHTDDAAGFASSAVPFGVGDATNGLALEGRAWLVRERGLSLLDDLAALQLVRPAAGAAFVPARPTVAGSVVGLTARRERTEINVEGGDETQLDLITVEWAPPRVEEGAYDRYDVVVRYPGEEHFRVAGETFATAWRMRMRTDMDTVEVGVRARSGPTGNATAGPFAYVTADLAIITNEG